MTTGEILAKKIADRRRGELTTARDVEIEKLNYFDPESASKHAKGLAKRLVETRRTERELLERLHSLGYTLSDGSTLKRLSKTPYGRRSPEEGVVYAQYDARLVKLAKASEKVLVALQGLKPAAAQPLLEAFRLEVDKL